MATRRRGDYEKIDEQHKYVFDLDCSKKKFQKVIKTFRSEEEPAGCCCADKNLLFRVVLVASVATVVFALILYSKICLHSYANSQDR